MREYADDCQSEYQERCDREARMEATEVDHIEHLRNRLNLHDYNVAWDLVQELDQKTEFWKLICNLYEQGPEDDDAVSKQLRALVESRMEMEARQVAEAVVE